jgi:protein-disulfide isomerase
MLGALSGGALEETILTLRLTSIAGGIAALLVAVAIATPLNAQPKPPVTPPATEPGKPPTILATPADPLLEEGPLPDMWLGAATAPVTVIEYASMTCPHCATFHNTVFEDFKRQYIDTGIVRFVVREFPLDDYAAFAFGLARCNATQDATGAEGYHAMIANLFADQAAWAGNYNGFVGLIEGAGLTLNDFQTCYDTLVDGILWSYNRGMELGVAGTPTFFINGERFAGVLSLAEIGQIVDRAAGR